MDAKRKILMDCDTGEDDAAAIILASASDKLELLGVTTCMGNLPLDQTLRNSLQLMDYLPGGVPVAKGSCDPLVRERWVGDEADRPLPIPGLKPAVGTAHELPAWDFMAKVLRESDSKVTLIPLAPLTNIAKLMLFYPDLVMDKVEEIIIMGGGFLKGNTTGAAELNIYADPEAAKAVFSFGVPVIMAGIDVCEEAYVDNTDLEMLQDLDNLWAAAYKGILHNDLKDGGWLVKGERGRVLEFDTLPVIYALCPEMFQGIKAEITVETESELCDGMTVCDARAGHPNLPIDESKRIHTVLLNIDREAYRKKVYELLANAK